MTIQNIYYNTFIYCLFKITLSLRYRIALFTFLSTTIILLNLASCQNKSSIKENIFKAKENLYAGQEDRAIEYANKVIHNDPRNSTAYQIKGEALFMLDKYEESKICLKKAIQIDWNNVASLYYYGVNCIYLDQFDTAFNYLNDAVIAKKPLGDSIFFDFQAYFAENDIPIAQILYFRGVANFNLKKYKSAQEDFTYSKSQNYEIGQSSLYLGLISYMYSKREEACNYLRIALEHGDDRAAEYLRLYCQ